MHPGHEQAGAGARIAPLPSRGSAQVEVRPKSSSARSAPASTMAGQVQLHVPISVLRFGTNRARVRRRCFAGSRLPKPVPLAVAFCISLKRITSCSTERSRVNGRFVRNSLIYNTIRRKRPKSLPQPTCLPRRIPDGRLSGRARFESAQGLASPEL
jgi:hypothetical protein